jgi:hypothetical protein
MCRTKSGRLNTIIVLHNRCSLLVKTGQFYKHQHVIGLDFVNSVPRYQILDILERFWIRGPYFRIRIRILLLSSVKDRL